MPIPRQPPQSAVDSLETAVTKLICFFVVIVAFTFLPEELSAQEVSLGNGPASAPSQQNQPPQAQKAEAEAERVVRRFRIGVQGGVGLDPEIIDAGVHAAFGPVFSRNVEFRPVFELGLGEVTTTLGINLDVLYLFPGSLQETQWTPYVGGGPHFGLSHQSFTTDDADNVDVPDGDDEESRFDFSDTDFDGGMNFIVGMRKRSGTFFEMKATAWGVSNIRLLVGFNF
jgi:hypothetical protein